MRHTWGVPGLAVGLCLVLAGCGSMEPPDSVAPPTAGGASSGPAMAPPAPRSEAARPASAAKAPAAPATASAPVAAIPRKVIYEGWLTVETNNTADAINGAQAAVKRRGGYVSNVQQSSGVGEHGEATVRVPSVDFEAAMAELAQLGTLRQRRIEAQDVGEEWVDTEARVTTKKHEEERLLNLLDKVTELSNVLELEKELARVRGEIEQAQGRLRFLSNQVELSTIHLSLNKPLEATRTGWRLSSVCRDAARVCAVVGQMLLTLLVYLAAMAPYGLLVWLLIWLARRADRRRADSASAGRR